MNYWKNYAPTVTTMKYCAKKYPSLFLTYLKWKSIKLKSKLNPFMVEKLLNTLNSNSQSIPKPCLSTTNSMTFRKNL